MNALGTPTRAVASATSAATPARRGPYEGVMQILRFNFPLFLSAATLVAAAAAALVWTPLPTLVRLGLIATITLVTGWSATTLLVSHHVYDRFPLFTFGWLAPYLTPLPRGPWANLHAGFDQTTAPLRQAFPHAPGIAIDLFDPAVMTERSIRRARRFYPAVPGTLPGRFDQLPLADATQETVFLLFAAHELRSPRQRAALFGEVSRVLRPGGTLVLVEHVRNAANFLVFGPGAFHFHPRSQWLRAGASARLALQDEFPLTRFATCFIWRKRP